MPIACYVVTRVKKNDGSDFEVVAVFSNHNDAETVCATQNAFNGEYHYYFDYSTIS